MHYHLPPPIFFSGIALKNTENLCIFNITYWLAQIDYGQKYLPFDVKNIWEFDYALAHQSNDSCWDDNNNLQGGW